MSFEIRLAAIEDAKVASKIVSEAAEWIASTRRPLWNPEHTSEDSFKDAISRAELYLGCVDGEPVATILIQKQDELFWPELPPGESLFVHRLAVLRKHSGKGIPQKLLKFAEELVKHEGRKYLRLDCSAKHGLRGYYEKAGFTFVDQRTVHINSDTAGDVKGDFTVDRLEKRVT